MQGASNKPETTGEWPAWAADLIAVHGRFRGGITTSIGVPSDVFYYIVHRMERERLDAMLDAEIGV